MSAEVDPFATLTFYKRLYPFKSIYTWLNHQHSPTRLFTHREFAFTLAGDVYIRFNSFANTDDLKREVCRLNPSRFEVGAIYNARPKDKKTIRANNFTPQLRELVFDIDMTDYDEIRTCCSGKGICKRCWGFIAAAVDVLEQVLRNQFGFEHLLWVYSGRRGIHCWISDQAALSLSDDARRSMVSYLEVVKGGSDTGKKVNVRGTSNTYVGGLHPMLAEALDTLTGPYASLILDDQNCFATASGWTKLLDLLPADDEIVSKFRAKWESEDEDGQQTSSQEKWNELRDEIKEIPRENIRRKMFQAALEDIVLQYTYPRIDAEVTKRRNHLLKAPFCIHPSTGRICVPVDPTQVHDFDPDSVPTLVQLLEELNAVIPEDGAEHHADWEKTSLKPYVQMLDRHVAGLMKEVRAQNRVAAMKSSEF